MIALPPRRSLSLMFALDRAEPKVRRQRRLCRIALAKITAWIAERYAAEQAASAASDINWHKQ